ncbi:MAG: hypothetical protein IJP01_05625, partial [Oscillospiraceae bacterium]|nr:hypothetical protein [Oscillospiraceae bacterium]
RSSAYISRALQRCQAVLLYYFALWQSNLPAMINAGKRQKERTAMTYDFTLNSRAFAAALA